MISRAKTRFPDIDFVAGDMSSLSFERGQFDAVFVSWNSLDALSPKEKQVQCMKEVWRVLRPDGFFVFSHHNLSALIFGLPGSPDREQYRFRIRQFFTGAAFKSESCIQSLHESFMVYYARPRQVITDVEKIGFRFIRIFSNDHWLATLQSRTGSTLLTSVADSFPYYVFRKPGRS